MKTRTLALAAAISTVVLAGTLTTVSGQSSKKAESRKIIQYGVASWYGGAFHGRRTAYGERFDRNKMTLASRSLPYNTQVRVTCLRTGKSCIARVTDYGPNGKCRHRIADLSEGVAAKIGIRSTGVGKVKIETLGTGSEPKQTRQAAVRAPVQKQPVVNKRTAVAAKLTKDSIKDAAPAQSTAAVKDCPPLEKTDSLTQMRR